MSVVDCIEECFHRVCGATPDHSKKPPGLITQWLFAKGEVARGLSDTFCVSDSTVYISAGDIMARAR
jgi:hypothetical protein